MGGVEGRGDEAGVNGGRDELFEGARGGEVEGCFEGVIGEGLVGAGEGKQREEEQLLVLRVGELGEVLLCWAELVARMQWSSIGVDVHL